MSTIFYQSISLTSIADATQDLWSIMASSTRRVELHSWELTSEALTATLVNLTLKRISAVGSGGAASSTEEPANEFDAAVTASVRTEDLTPGTPAGDLQAYKWEQLGPVGHTWIPEDRPISKVSEGFALVCDTAIILDIAGWIAWAEI